MVGFYSGDPVESPGVNAEGTNAVPATTGQVIGATATEAFEGGATPRLLRQAEQVDLPPVSSIRDPRMPQSFAGESTAPSDTPVQDAPKLSPDDANAQFGIKGPTPETSLTFKSPIPQAAAEDLYNHQRAENLRLDTLSRAQPGVLTSAPAQALYGLVGGTLDPSNLALAFIPGLGEANEARIAASVGGGFVGRTAARAASGAVAGGAGMAALEPLNYGLDQAEGKEWSMGQAMRDIAWGTALGGGLHVMGGAVSDALGRTVPTQPIPAAVDRLDPQARVTLVQGAIAQAMDDRPVDVQPAFELFQQADPQAPFIPPAPPAAADEGTTPVFTNNRQRIDVRPGNCRSLGSHVEPHARR